MTEAERHRLMLDVLKDRPFASVRDLQAVVEASPATIRRDIAKLHASRRGAQGVRRHRRDRNWAAGWIAWRPGPSTENQMLQVAAKKAIAEAAAALVQRRRRAHHPWRLHLLSLRPAAGQAQRAHLHQFHAARRDPLAERHLPPDAWQAAISTASRASLLASRRGSAGILCLEILPRRAGHHAMPACRNPTP